MGKSSLQRVLEAGGLECQSYSGRGMFGASCLGVVTRSPGELAEAVLQGVLELGDLTPEDYAGVKARLHNSRRDSMGFDIISYWPSTPYVAEDGLEEDCEVRPPGP